MPLLRSNIDYHGLDLSAVLCEYAREKISGYDTKERFFTGDMRSFDLDMQFDCIFIAFNSFLHILSDEDAMASFRCIRNHLRPGGQFVLDILFPNPHFLYREPQDKEIPVMDFKDSTTGELIEIFERCEYDNATEICDLKWEYRGKNSANPSRVFEYQMRMYYPDTMNRLLIDAGFTINDRLGDYDGGRFNEHSALQVYICQ